MDQLKNEESHVKISNLELNNRNFWLDNSLKCIEDRLSIIFRGKPGHFMKILFVFFGFNKQLLDILSKNRKLGLSRLKLSKWPVLLIKELTKATVLIAKLNFDNTSVLSHFNLSRKFQLNSQILMLENRKKVKRLWLY